MIVILLIISATCLILVWTSLVTHLAGVALTCYCEICELNNMRNSLVVLASILVLAPTLAYPETNPSEITLLFHAPDARSVEVVGDFNAWLPGSNSLRGPDQRGMWQVVITIPSGTRRNEYIYLVNGKQRVLDTTQPVVNDDFGEKNNIWLSQ